MSSFTGTGRLVRLALRRDRVLLPIWLVSLAALTAGVAGAIVGLYATAAERAAAAELSAATTVVRIFDGPASGASVGAMVMLEAFQVLAVLVAVMSAQTVVRHTRQDEETGRAELLGAGVVGHHARLAAALVVAVAANLVVGATIAVVLTANDLGAAGAIASGVAVAGVGIVFAGVAAVTAQLASTARGANGLAGSVLGVSLLLRAVGDTLGHVAASGVEVISAWPSWLSPIGWGQQVRPFHQDNWDVLALFVGLFLVLVVVAFVLTWHHDVGSGIVPARSGPRTAPTALLSPLGLAWRLQRGVLLAWMTAFLIIAAAFGAVGDTADDLLDASQQLKEALHTMMPEGGLVDLYFAFLMGILGVAAAGFTVQALLRLRTEEAAGRLEPVLATAVGRPRWLASHLLVAAAGTAAVLGGTGLVAALAYGAVTGDLATGAGALQAALAQIPATLALGGSVVAVFALLPRFAAAIAWAALAVSLVLGQLGAVLQLPQPVLNLSPFTHVPSVPAEAFRLLPMVLLLGVAVVSTMVGVGAFRRRDLAIAA